MSTVSDQQPFNPAFAGADASDAAATRTASVRTVSWPLWIVLTLFWIYVTLSNVLYTHYLSLALDPGDVNHYFSDWDVRVLQHVFLYPILLGAIWASLRLGWRPPWRAVPLQLAIAIGFAALALPSIRMAGDMVVTHEPPMGSIAHKEIFNDWVASMTTFLLAYGFALALATGMQLYQRYRDSELKLTTLERAWCDARLEALRMQLSPHTLFNLLHTIRGQIGWDPAAAQSMVVQLGDLLRRLLAAGQREFCRLGDEIQFVQLYLELQQGRFADRLRLTLPNAEQVPDVWVPSLILQPLVENAVVHGLAGHTDRVAIEVATSVLEDALLLRVSNTTAKDVPLSGGGIGLRNVRERLAVHFGTRASVRSGPSGPHEWSTTIRIPLIYDER
jgi:Histidine kinase